ncbi:MAG: ATP-dependent DNA helicase [Methanomassiliicoccaceae archaeon]|nr:ATP-dependent DNA helicase [Methanomassiliicoccaceae archaeon]
MHLFPYTPRRSQKEFVEFVDRCVREGIPCVLESGTGTGKTICALAGALPYALENGKRIVYLTRTSSQQKQAILELRKISKIRKLFAMGIQGRGVSTCPRISSDPELMGGSPDELSKFCAEFKKRTGTDKGCKFYDNILATDMRGHIEFCSAGMPTSDEFSAYALDKGLCPYEMMKRLIQDADVVIAPYHFIFVPGTRQRFLGWMNVSLRDIVIIVDEAHNLPDHLREVMTHRYTMHSLNLAESEAKEWNDPPVGNGISATGVIGVVRKLISYAAQEFLRDDDGLIPPYFIEDGFLEDLRVTSHKTMGLCKALIEHGEIVAETKKTNGKLPRSYMRSLGSFLEFWLGSEDEIYVKLIVEDDALEAFCMDPYEAAEPLRSCHASIHMSGTLEPLSEYRNVLGLENAKLERFASPFDPDNLMTVHATDVTSRYEEIKQDETMIPRMEDHVVSIANAVKKNTAVFFPSYTLMDTMIRDGICGKLGRKTFIERKGMTNSEHQRMVDDFKGSGDGVLFAVSGGRISEGIDFPGKEMELAILAGMPFAKPGAKLDALTRYYDIRSGNGWELAVLSPTLRKMRQAMGRLIRSESDVAVAVILDKRAAAYALLAAKRSLDVPADVRGFFLQHGNDRPHG